MPQLHASRFSTKPSLMGLVTVLLMAGCSDTDPGPDAQPNPSPDSTASAASTPRPRMLGPGWAAGSCSSAWIRLGLHWIYTANSDGSDVEQVFAEEAEGARWSPDGTDIALFCCDDGMAAHIVDPATGDLRTLAPPDPNFETFCGGPWTPDGNRLTCESFGAKDPRRNGIYSIRAYDGGGLTRITSSPGRNDRPGDYSPDGKQLVFQRANRAGPLRYAPPPEPL